MSGDVREYDFQKAIDIVIFPKYYDKEDYCISPALEWDYLEFMYLYFLTEFSYENDVHEVLVDPAGSTTDICVSTPFVYTLALNEYPTIQLQLIFRFDDDTCKKYNDRSRRYLTTNDIDHVEANGRIFKSYNDDLIFYIEGIIEGLRTQEK